MAVVQPGWPGGPVGRVEVGAFHGLDLRPVRAGHDDGPVVLVADERGWLTRRPDPLGVQLAGSQFHFGLGDRVGRGRVLESPSPSVPGPAAPVGLAHQHLAGRVGGRLHFTVGGKRFRPCLEDVIEMLTVEGLLSGRDGWSDAVESTDQGFIGSNSWRRSDEILKQLLRSWRSRM